MKPATARNTALLLMICLSTYLVFNIATKDIQVIIPYNWYTFLIDIRIHTVIVIAACIKMRQ
jgi:hypothetical protein